MEWLTRRKDGTVKQQATSGGVRHDIKFANAAHPLLVWAPFLPMTTTAQGTSVSVPYCAVASVIWALFLHKPAHWHAKVALLLKILRPEAMHKAVMAAVREGFPMTAFLAWGHLVSALQNFAVSHANVAEFMLQADVLADLEGGSVAQQPAIPHELIADIELCDLAQTSGSMASLSVTEILMAPRLLVATRFNATHPIMMLADDLQDANAAYDIIVKMRIKAGRNAAALQQLQLQRFMTFFKEHQTPLVLINPSFLGVTDPNDRERADLQVMMLEYTFHDKSREDLSRRNIINICKSTNVLKHIILPTPSAEVCAKLLTSLLLKLHTGQALTTVQAVALVDGEIERKHLSSLVNTDETRLMSGEDKVALIITHLDAFKSQGAQPAGHHASAASSTTLEFGPVAPSDSLSLRHFLLTTEVIEVETALRAALLLENPITAITILSRCKIPVLTRLLHTYKTMGVSDVFAQAYTLRVHVHKAASYAVVAEADPKTNKLSVPPGLENFEIDADWWAKFWKCSYLKLDFHELTYMVTLKLNGGEATERYVARTKALTWGDVSTNLATAELADNLFHFKGWDSGVFVDVVQEVNKRLLHTHNLNDTNKLVVQRDCTKAMQLAIAEMTASHELLLLADSPVAKFPHKGTRLLDTGSAFYSALKDLDENLKLLRSTRKWQGDNAEGEREELRRMLRATQALQGGHLSPHNITLSSPQWHGSS